MVEVDLDFHRLLCELSGNTALVRTWDMLAGSIRMSIMFAGPRAVANMSVPRHQQVVDAIARHQNIARNAVASTCATPRGTAPATIVEPRSA